MKYEVGDRVIIVNHWVKGCKENDQGMMDHWLGKEMTIRSRNESGYRMVEDMKEHVGNGWIWNDKCIAGLAYEIDPKQLGDLLL